MKFIFVLIIVLFVLFWWVSRTVLLHPLKSIFYIFYDLFDYLKNKKWKTYKEYGIYLYGGSFGNGKTLSIVRKVNQIYKKYDNIEVISNVDLNIPYTKFEYFEQFIEPVPGGITRIFVIDELGSLMNSRNYKNNKISETEFLYHLMQVRKEHKVLLASTQRFGMCDKLFREVAVYWIECSHFWRFYRHLYYDAYDLEFSQNPSLVKPLFSRCYFADNKLFSSYNTFQLVKDFKPLEIENRTSDNNFITTRYNRKGRKSL